MTLINGRRGIVYLPMSRRQRFVAAWGYRVRRVVCSAIGHHWERASYWRYCDRCAHVESISD